MARSCVRILALSASNTSIPPAVRMVRFALTDSAWTASVALRRGRTMRVPICVIMDEERGPDRFAARSGTRRGPTVRLDGLR